MTFIHTLESYSKDCELKEGPWIECVAFKKAVGMKDSI